MTLLAILNLLSVFALFLSQIEDSPSQAGSFCPPGISQAALGYSWSLEHGAGLQGCSLPFTLILSSLTRQHLCASPFPDTWYTVLDGPDQVYQVYGR